MEFADASTRDPGADAFTLDLEVRASEGLSWRVVDDADWITVVRSGNSVRVEGTANIAPSARSGQVTLRSGAASRSVTVRQDGMPVGISGLRLEQIPESRRVRATYDMMTDDASDAVVTVELTPLGGGLISAPTLTGDLGSEIAPGLEKTVEWDAGADWDLRRGEVRVRVSCGAGFAEDTLDLDTRDYVLEVGSDHGVPNPPVGTHVKSWRSEVTCTAPVEAVTEGIKYFCSGWIGTGSVPATGEAREVSVVLDVPDSSLEWSWERELLELVLPAEATEGAHVLASPQPAGSLRLRYAVDRNLRVFLSSSDETELGVPEYVDIPHGHSEVTIPLEFPADGIPDGPQTVTVSAQVLYRGFEQAAAGQIVVDDALRAAIHVDPDAATSTWGTDWNHPYANLADAARDLRPGESIWIKRGTLRMSGEIAPAGAVEIHGGFVGTETSPDQRAVPIVPSVLDATVSGRHFYFTHEARLTGLSLRNGRSASGGSIVAGAGIELEDCRFESNRAVGFADETAMAGAVYISGNGRLLARRVAFEGNSTAGAAKSSGSSPAVGGDGVGGAVAVFGEADFEDCVFKFNRASGGDGDGGRGAYGQGGKAFGGALAGIGASSLTFDRCVFDGNTAEGGDGQGGRGIDSSNASGGDGGDGYGGPAIAGAVAGQGGEIRILNSVFVNNRAAGGDGRGGPRGSGPLNDWDFSYASSATGGFAQGGGAVNVHLVNCTLLNNAVEGGAATKTGRGTATTGQTIGPALKADSSFAGTIRNSVFSPFDSAQVFGNWEARDSLIELSGAGNWTGTAGWKDVSSPSGADGIWKTDDDGLRLTPDSACVDRGQLAWLPGEATLDLIGTPRQSGAEVDVGAYEYREIPVYTLELVAMGAGSLDAGGGDYPEGTHVTVNALPAAHNHFVEWTGDLAGCAVGGAHIEIPMTSARRIVAHFAVDLFDVEFLPGDHGTHGGGGALMQKVEATSSAQIPEIRSNPGWRFEEWALDPTSADLSAVTTDIVARAEYSRYASRHETRKLQAADGIAGKWFGDSVSTDGSRVAVGAPLDDPNGEGSGSVCLFDPATGTQLIKLYPDGGNPWDFFGDAVAVHGDKVVVGAWFDDTRGEDAGSGFLFDSGTGELLRRLAPASIEAGDYLGYDVAVDGRFAVVGGYNDNSNGTKPGRAFVFPLTQPGVERELAPSDGAGGDSFGWSVAVDGGIVAVGAPTPDPAFKNAGAVYVFDADTGAFLRKLVSPEAAERQNFGYSVSLSEGRLLVGAPDSRSHIGDLGRAYLFDVSNGALLQTFTPQDTGTVFFGISVSLSGTHVLAGSFWVRSPGGGGGCAYLFDASTGELVDRLLPTDGGADDEYGGSVSVAGDLAVVGAPGHEERKGAVYIFDLSDLREYENGTDPLRYVLELTPGWNLVSIALAPSDHSVDGIFGDSIDKSAWRWDGEVYRVAEDILPLAGQWVYCPAEETVSIDIGAMAFPGSPDSDGDGLADSVEEDIGTDPDEYAITLHPGWNLVSICRVPMDNSPEAIFGDEVILPLWEWQEGKYKRAEKIKPLKGYWVYFKGEQSAAIVIIE